MESDFETLYGNGDDIIGLINERDDIQGRIDVAARRKQKKKPKLLKKQLLPLKLRLILRLNKREKLLKLLLPNNKPKLKL